MLCLYTHIGRQHPVIKSSNVVDLKMFHTYKHTKFKQNKHISNYSPHNNSHLFLRIRNVYIIIKNGHYQNIGTRHQKLKCVLKISSQK